VNACPLAVVVGELDVLHRSELVALGLLPLRVGPRRRDIRTRRRDPAELGEIGMLGRARRQELDLRALRVGGLAIIPQIEIVEPPAGEID